MILPEEAQHIIQLQKTDCPAETCSLSLALNRVLATDIYADMAMPPFDKSAMDGFACRKADLPGPLRIIETIAAGVAPQFAINPGECTRLMTGCKIPEGADCVIKVEETISPDADHILFAAEKTASNICLLGEDFMLNDKVLNQGTRLKPWHIAILASVGCTDPLVYKAFRCGILATGDELVEPGVKPAESQIRNSNGWQLIAQCQDAGLIPEYYGIIPDVPEILLAGIEKSISNNTITLLTGGVSMGDFDFVPAMLRKAGVEILFEKIAVQPGSPTVFGRRDGHFVFGLPGNPVSTLTQFELLVNPLIRTLYQMPDTHKVTRLPLQEDFTRKNAGRKAWFPVKVEADGSVTPLSYHGSAHILGYNGADAIACIEPGMTILRKGDYTDVRFL